MNHTFQYQSGNLFYRSEGAGSPVVLLHGFAEDHRVWNKQVAFLKDHCRLIIPDLPGSGRSDILQKEMADVRIEAFAEAIYALIKHEDAEQCILLGHSMGGYIVLALAEKYQHLLKGFGFVHSTAFADSDEKKAIRQKAIGTIEEWGSAAFIKSTTPNVFAAKYKAEHPQEIEILIEQGQNFQKVALQQYYTAMLNRPDRSNVLIKSSKPVLFIIGMEDTAAPPADVLKQVHLPAVSYIYTLNNVGHMGMWEATDKVNEYLLYFIQEADKFINV